MVNDLKNTLEEIPIYKLENIPVFQNKVYDKQEQAINVDRENVELVFNITTGLIHNRVFNQELMKYDATYQNEQGNSPFFMDYLKGLIYKFENLGVLDKKIVEIGCGKGLFLELLRENGCDITGFDPTYEGDKPYIVKEYFSKESNSVKGDFIFLRHTLEHIPNPCSFIKEIAEANGGEGEIFIEVPTFDWIIENDAFYDIFYEHVNYFTELSLSNMFNKCDTGLLFNGQYIYVHADLKDIKKNQLNERYSTDAKGIEIENQILQWRLELSKFDKVFVWGAGAKGSTFLNHIDPKGEIVDSVIDLNPKKQNKFLGGTGHFIIHPEEIKSEGNTVILVMNRNYLNEIKGQLADKDISILSL